MIKKFIQRLVSTIAFGLSSTNFGNALYAYQSGPYGQRQGFLDPNTNAFVVWSNATFSVVATSAMMFLAFKK